MHGGACMSEIPNGGSQEDKPNEPSQTVEGNLSDSTADSLAQKLPKIIPFRDLCRCGDEVWIEHQGQLYRLRCTKQGKLLLTK